MKTLLQSALLLLALLLPATATAHNFEVDGIYYNIYGNNATVTYKGSYPSQYSNEYNGDVTIPSTIRYCGTTCSVTSIGYNAFSGCSGLTSITIPRSVISIGYAPFSYCSGLTSIQVDNGNPTYDSRNNCNAIIETSTNMLITGCMNTIIPNSVTSIGDGAFFGCSGLTSIYIPNSVTSIGSAAFSGCSGLTSIDLPNSVTSIGGYTFSGCSGLTSIDLPNSVTSIGGYTFSGCSGLASVIIGNSVTGIGEEAFSECSGLTSINIPNSVTSIGYCAFWNCSSLTNITIPNSVTSIVDGVFMGCSGLTGINIPNCVDSIGNRAFDGCSGLTSIYIPNSVTSIGWGAFSGCSGLTNINIPNAVTSIGDFVFSGCTGLTGINIPNSVDSIGNCAFDDCSGLTSINIPNSVTTIGDCAFCGCSSLTSIYIPNSVTSIGSAAFSGCSGLTSVTMPNSVDFSYVSFSGLFSDCNNLTTLFLTGYGAWFFSDLPNVTTLYIDKGITGVTGIREKPLDVFSFAVAPPTCDENSFLDYSGTLHVPAASLAAYFTAPYWCNFANIVGDAVRPSDLTLDKDSIDLIVQEMTALSASIIPVTASSGIINWVSSTPAVATVVNGQVTGIGLGECDIIATFLDKRAVCHVVVYNDRISVDQQEVQVLPNHMMTLTPTSLAPTLPSLTVTSSDLTVAAARVMNGKVQIVGVSEGTATITVASADGTAKPATCLVTVYTELGDANGDGFIDIDDVTSLIERVLGNDVPTFKENNGDMNGDGILDIDDITALINTILGTT